MTPRALPRRPSRPAVLALSASVALAAPPGTLGAQSSELAVEVGASRVLPPVGVDGGAASFLVGGLRGSRYTAGGSGIFASVLAGRSTDSALGGDFVSGDLGAVAWQRLGLGWSVGLEGRVFGFGVADPFPYGAGAAEGDAILRYRSPSLQLRVAGTGGVGRSRVTLTELVQTRRRQTTLTQVLEDDLWRYGGTAEALVSGSRASAGVAAGIHRSAAGSYRSAGVRLLLGGAGGLLELRGDAWRTPVGNQTTGGIAFYLPWGGWSLRGVAGRPEPDPLLVAEPGKNSSGLLFGRRIAGSGAANEPEGSLHRVLGATPAGAPVRFVLETPGTASTVAVLGDFTLWEPVALTREGPRWAVEVEVPSGTHHFGFLVDGAWYVPDDAPDAVSDEWGRRNATLVIEEGDAGAGASALAPRQGVGES